MMIYLAKRLLIALLCITTTTYTMDHFAMPPKKSVPPFKPFAPLAGTSFSTPSLGKGPAAKSKDLLKGETSLENEILSLGNEFEQIARELSKIGDSKEIKQEIEKKRAARDKKNPGTKPGFGGGYRPGSYKPGGSYGGYGSSKPYGGSSPFGRSSSSPFGRSSSPLGGSFGGFGGFGSSPLVKKSFGSGEYKTPASSFGSKSGLNDLSPEPESNTPKTPKFYGSKSGKDKLSKDEESPEAKAMGNLERYIGVLEKELQQIAATQDQQVRNQRILHFPLGELNKLFDDAFSTERTMTKAAQEELEKNDTWKTHNAKLKKLQLRMAPILIELMIPSSAKQVDKISDARRTFEQLDIGSTISQETLQGLVTTRCNTVAGAFRARGQGKTKDERKPLVEELEKIIDTFPADKFGSPIPPILTKALRDLQK